MRKDQFLQIRINDGAFRRIIDGFERTIDKLDERALLAMGWTLVEKADEQVPHDTGYLQSTGHAEVKKRGVVWAGYNTVYAARLHEHPEYRFQKGRKGKYVIDPLKKNLRRWLQVYADEMKGAF